MNTDNTLNVLEQTQEKKKNFLTAWKEGVLRIGPELFGPAHPQKATALHELCPNRSRIEKEFLTKSGGERQLLAAMVSFYDPDWGEALVASTSDEKSVCGLTYNMDHNEISILCSLLQNFCGWEEP